MSREKTQQTEQEQKIAAAKRLLRVKQAREDLLRFTELSMPHPEEPENPERSRYNAKRHHRYIADILQKVERGEILRLILTVQPRAGKSELVSNRFPAWFVGQDGYRQVAVASYADTLAQDFGREVRQIMRDPFYQQVFPGVQLRKGSQSIDRQQTTQGGIMNFVGVGTGLTGKGADCLPAGVKIATDKGELPIEEIVASPYCEVLTYNHSEGCYEYKPIQGVARRQKAGLRRITTAAGRVVEATADHRVWTGRGYIRADQLTPGDSLLCDLPEGSRPAGTCHAEGAQRHVLLQPGLLVRGAKHAAIRAAHMLGLWGRSAESDIVWPGRGALLLDGVPRHDAGAAQGCNPREQHPAVRVVRHIVRASEQVFALLLPSMRFAGALGPDGPGRESEVEGWGNAAPSGPREPGVSRDAAVGGRGGRPSVRGVRTGEHAPGSASPEQRPHGQPRPEPGDAMLGVSQGVAPCGSGGQSDTVALVEHVHTEPQVVYDLQVADNHNFFANGLLVHNCLIIDDPIKDDIEANSKTTRDRVWGWFNRVALTRLMGAARVVICMTRWHEDDLVGRLTNPKNPHYNPDEAAKWTVVNIPAFAEEGDPVGREPGEILWPERTSQEFLESMRRLDPQGFSALYMGRPAPPEGTFFKNDHIRSYQPHELPKNLKYYAASDHAVSEAESADPTCMGCVGVDEDDNIYIMPDIDWRKMDAEVAVEAMLSQMQTYHPMFWWAEKGHISQSIGPFLRKRMQETNTYIYIDEKTPTRDKQTRAQAIQGRMAMGKVFLPAFAPWFQDAKDELLNFPNGTHDDFVDWIAWIGRGLAQQTQAQAPVKRSNQPETGSIQWIVQMGDRVRRRNDTHNRPERRYLQ